MKNSYILKLSLYISFGLIIFFIIFANAFSYFVNMKIQTTITNEYSIQNKHIPKIKEDLAQISLKDPFFNVTRTNNASKYLLSIASLPGTEINLTHLGIPVETWNEISNKKPREISIIKNINFKNMNFQWVDELQKFDNINFITDEFKLELAANLASSNNAIEQAEHFMKVFRITNQIDYIRLQNALVMYLTKAKYENKLLQALSKYRHISHLLYTSYDITSKLTAYNLLHSEHDFVSSKMQKKWKLFSKNEIMSLRRLTRKSDALFKPMLLEKYKDIMNNYFFRSEAICGSYIDNIILSYPYIRDIFSGPILFENNYTETINYVNKVYTDLAPICNFQDIWNTIAIRKYFYLSSKDTSKNFFSFPYVRQLLAVTLNVTHTSYPDY